MRRKTDAKGTVHFEFEGRPHWATVELTVTKAGREFGSGFVYDPHNILMAYDEDRGVEIEHTKELFDAVDLACMEPGALQIDEVDGRPVD